jgi:high-affinity K+ transport system ATPase subunit B
MNEKTDPFIRDLARLVGKEVAKTSEFALDRAQDVMILLLQKAAAASVGNRRRKDALAKASMIVSNFSQSAFIAPLVAGRVAAASTYVGLRAGVEVVSGIQRILAGLIRQ